MKSPLVKSHWLDRAIEVYNFHVKQFKSEPGWTLAKTAETLNRSLGSVSQDIMIAHWSRTHENQLRRCDSMKDALAWIKMKKQEMLEEI